MRNIYIIFLSAFFLFLQSCSSSRKTVIANNDTEIKSRVAIKNDVRSRTILTRNVSANEVVAFAETLQGIPYKYGSTDINKGFDCSGFISYVFGHFNIAVPRSSVDFTNVGKEVSMKDCRRGDIILFTGSNENSGIVGHMGIITSTRDKKILFIHAASGGGKGVMISGMSEYFRIRFVKVIRVFSNFE